MSINSALVSAVSMTSDVHHKLCKKVALLTKVIYHLNIKNEDADENIGRLRALHTAEISRVSTDASEKIARLTEELTNNKEVARLEAALTALRDMQLRDRDAAKALVFEAETNFK